jgi:hypothetical protein
MLRRSCLIVILILSTIVGFGAADLYAGLYEFCNPTAVGAACPATCGATICTNKGVTCNVVNVANDACTTPGCICFNSVTCAGRCGGVSPACACGSVTGACNFSIP